MNGPTEKKGRGVSNVKAREEILRLFKEELRVEKERKAKGIKARELTEEEKALVKAFKKLVMEDYCY